MSPAPDILRIPNAYTDPAGADRAKAELQKDAWGCLDSVMLHEYGVAQLILMDWALHCREVQGADSRLLLTIKGVSMLEAFILMIDQDWNKEPVRIWFRDVYRPCAQAEADRHFNNRGFWGILGCILADKILNRDLTPYVAKLSRMLDIAVGSKGELQLETRRTNMGIFYSTWTLSAALRSCQLLQTTIIDRLQKPLWWLWQFIRDPDSWPYRPGKWPFLKWPWPKLERIFWPTTDELDRPRANDEAGALYLAAGRQFGVQEWIEYAKPWPADPPFPGVNVGRWQR